MTTHVAAPDPPHLLRPPHRRAHLISRFNTPPEAGTAEPHGRGPSGAPSSDPRGYKGRVWELLSALPALPSRTAVVPQMVGMRSFGERTSCELPDEGEPCGAGRGPLPGGGPGDGCSGRRTVDGNPPPPRPRVGKPGGQRVGEGVGGAFYPNWRAGSKFWRLVQNKGYYVVLAVQVSFHFAWHSSIGAAPNILVFGNFAEFRRLVGPLADSGGGGGGVVDVQRAGGGGTACVSLDQFGGVSGGGGAAITRRGTPVH